jgi:hypothetical protein
VLDLICVPRGIITTGRGRSERFVGALIDRIRYVPRPFVSHPWLATGDGASKHVVVVASIGVVVVVVGGTGVQRVVVVERIERPSSDMLSGIAVPVACEHIPRHIKYGLGDCNVVGRAQARHKIGAKVGLEGRGRIEREGGRKASARPGSEALASGLSTRRRQAHLRDKVEEQIDARGDGRLAW